MGLRTVLPLNLRVMFSLVLLAISVVAHLSARETIHVAVASSLRGPLEEIRTQFEQRHPEYHVTVAYVASGKLVAQVTHGAPYQLLVSAEPRYLDMLHARDLTLAAPMVIGYGELVLWHPDQAGTIEQIIEQADFVALAQPKHAPYGQAALAYLQRHFAHESYADKLVYGDNVAQAAHRVHVGAADVGFVALAQILELGLPSSAYTRLPTAPRLPQAIALTHQAKQNSGAQLLYDFMLAVESQQILATFGYQSTAAQEFAHVASD